MAGELFAPDGVVFVAVILFSATTLLEFSLKKKRPFGFKMDPRLRYWDDNHYNSNDKKDHPVQQAWQEALTDSRLSLTRAAYSPHSSPSIGGESRHNKDYLNDFLTFNISNLYKTIKAMFSFLGK
ncbi:MAG: hypothetical protein LBV66_01005, partial [Elusimicrobiota bacterium]|nr:hypothetical protein [Elusimicrobiota bacterium]